MDDLAIAQNENENLRKIRGRLLQWESDENGLAMLSLDQQECLETINGIWQEQETETYGSYEETYESSTTPILNASIGTHNLSGSASLRDLEDLPKGLESTHEFLLWYDRAQSEIQQHCDEAYYKYLQQLELRGKECYRILEQIELAMEKLRTLNVQYTLVANKTRALNSASEKLIDEQQKLQELSNEIQRRLHYFNQVEVLHQRLQSPTLSVPSDSFRDCLDKIDACLEYLKANPKFKDSSGFIVKYKHCLSKAISLIKNYVNTIMSQATEATLHPKIQQQQSGVSNIIGSTSTDAAFALFYGKYQSCSAKIKRVSQMVEERIKSCSEYEQLLSDIQQNYLNERASIMSPAVNKAIMELKASHKGDHCTLMRSTCAFLVNVSQDEYRLFFNFFSMPSEQLNTYLEGLCTILYDTMRPFIIHINHLETLAEICSILRIEMLEEHVQQSPESLEAFASTANQMLQDVQERLVFRAHLYLQSDILNYNPSAGDLAYPDKLAMMESIALSLQDSSAMRRSDSRSSLISYASTESVDTQAYKTRNMNSPADLHGMWYPTVRRTLVCLSRLYRCVDRPIFQGLSQDALRLCIQSVSKAAVKIAAAKTPIDGELFEIKHLLILREQIAPFRVDFTIKETSLDFSKVKTAAFGLLQRRKQLFSMGSNNALLEFLLEGTPQIKEHLLDSRKEVDRQLKTICEQFIKDSVEMLVGPLIIFLDKAQILLSAAATTNTTIAAAGTTATSATPTNLISEKSTPPIPVKINYALRQAAWAAPQKISSIIQETQRLIKNKLPSLQRSMQLYLSNRDTEFIIFRPIRNNIIQTFVKLEQLLTGSGYTSDDMIITGCPSADQVSILLSSASILAAEGIANFSAAAQQRKISTSSNESTHHLNPPVGLPTTTSGTAITRKSSYDKAKHPFETQVMENLTEVPEPISSAASPITISPTPATAEDLIVKHAEEEGEGEKKTENVEEKTENVEEKKEKDMYKTEAFDEDTNKSNNINPSGAAASA